MKTVKVNNMDRSNSSAPSLRSQNGQIAIFLVLIFQVLFVFFAMTVNVGLVIYDKINLQNATDMAAYYSAQRQAELLNQIAHVNYQVRQAYKLLTFRLRVFGSLSVGIGINPLLEPHPIFMNPGIAQEQSDFFKLIPAPGGISRPPGVCVGSTIWSEYAMLENGQNSSLCRNLRGFTPVPPISGGGGDITGLIGSLNGFLTTILGQVEQQCKTIGVLNWQFASSILLAYKLEAIKRAQMIDELAANMSQTGATMNDFRGQSVYTGALNTLRKNLTDSQAQTLDMKLVNSLSTDVPGPCADPRYWLPKIEIYPVVTYVKMVLGAASICITTTTPSSSSATLPPADYINLVGGRNNGLLASVWSDGNPIPMGVEKNPWCMPYMGVRASTSPRKIFAPFGSPVILKAESYAKPFGGRVGPWYSTVWPSGSPYSIGADKVDPLLPTRSLGGTPGPGSNRDNDIVNYSKYPGDKLGMNSRYALGAMSAFWNTTMMRGAPVAGGALPPALSLQHYNHVGDPSEFDTAPDSLARQNTSPISAANVRLMEEAAIAPDFFDMMYYSIESQYSYNYFNPNDTNFKSFLTEYWLDLGSQNRSPYSIVDQITDSNTVYQSASPFYMVNDPNQLLTGWTQQSASNYDFPDSFGKCLGPRKDAESEFAPAPSGCPYGGRSGYSIKIVSKNYLNSIDADLGGPGQAGPILNPPASN